MIDSRNGRQRTLLGTLAQSAGQALAVAAGRLFPEAAVKAVMGNLKTGCIEVELPEGGLWILGDPAAAERCRVCVKDRDLFANLVRYWDIGLGESYQAGHYEVDDLPRFLAIIVRNLAHLPGISGSTLASADVNRDARDNRAAHERRGNTLKGSRENIAYHYDLGNDFYSLFLDPTLAYSSAIYPSRDATLQEAQVHKFDVLCRKLELKPGEEVLEIGSGWGGFALHAAGRYGCKVTTLTLSREQKDLAERRIRAAGLSDRIEVRFQDYRDLSGQYDKIASIEMFEAVGHEWFGTFFAKCRAALKPEGLMAMQVITIPDSRFDAYKGGCDWIQKHIFPGCLLPSIHEMSLAIRDSGGLMIQHLENFDLHYARTLKDWRSAFLVRLDEVRGLGFDQNFIRTWDYYLAYCEAAFRTRNLGLVQLVLSFPNNPAMRGHNFLED